MAMSIFSSVMFRRLPQMVWQPHDRTVQRRFGLTGICAATRCTLTTGGCCQDDRLRARRAGPAVRGARHRSGVRQRQASTEIVALPRYEAPNILQAPCVPPPATTILMSSGVNTLID